MEKCSTRVWTDGEGKVLEEETDSAKADTTKKNDESTTSTTGKTFQTREAKQSCWT